MRGSTTRFNPWHRMRELGPSWKLRWLPLDGDTYGYTCHDTRTITLHADMSFEERRCTVAHEVEHARRGPTSLCSDMAEELEVDRAVARLLVPSIRALCDALIWYRGDYERAAEELWVDPIILEVRLSALTTSEAGYYQARMADAILMLGDE